MGLKALPDPVDEAIAAVDAQEQAVPMVQVQVTISSTGRPAQVAIPADATDGELAELAGWLLTAVMNGLRQQRAANPASRIIVPH